MFPPSDPLPFTYILLVFIISEHRNRTAVVSLVSREKFSGEKVPTLQEAVEECMRHQLTIFFDVKGQPDKVLNIYWRNKESKRQERWRKRMSNVRSMSWIKVLFRRVYSILYVKYMCMYMYSQNKEHYSRKTSSNSWMSPLCGSIKFYFILSFLFQAASVLREMYKKFPVLYNSSIVSSFEPKVIYKVTEPMNY